MPNYLVELRKRTGSTYGDKILLATDKTLVEGLLAENGKINDALFPDYLFGGMRPGGTFSVTNPSTATYTTDDIKSILDSYVASNGGTANGVFAVCSNNGTQSDSYPVEVSTGHTLKDIDGTILVAGESTHHVNAGDWIISLNDDGTELAIVNNAYDLASSARAGLMSSSDYSKLSDIEAEANKYIHPSYTSATLTHDGIQVVGEISVDSKGHVDYMVSRTLPKATETDDGVMSSEDKAKLNTVDSYANNYSHPTGGADVTENLGGIEKIASIAVDLGGHVTAVSKESIRSATEALKGVVELATTTESLAGTDNERAVSPKSFKGAVDRLLGFPIFESQSVADTAADNNDYEDGSLAFVEV